MTESDAGEGNHSCEPSPGMVGPQWQFNRINRRKKFLIKNTEQVMTELDRLIQSKADMKRVERQLAKLNGLQSECLRVVEEIVMFSTMRDKSIEKS